MAFIVLKTKTRKQLFQHKTIHSEISKDSREEGVFKEGPELSGRLPLTPEELSLSWSYHLSLACDRSHWWAASQGLHRGEAEVQQAGGMSSAGPDGAAWLPRKQYYLRSQASQRQV